MKSTGLQEDIHGSGTQRIMEASAFIDSQHILDPLASHSANNQQSASERMPFSGKSEVSKKKISFVRNLRLDEID